MNIALLGLGTVGLEVARLLIEDAQRLKHITGEPLPLAAIVDKDLSPRAGFKIPKSVRFTDDLASVLADPSITVLVELIGGTKPAKTFVRDALRAGKHVVTANKALLAESGPELRAEADRAGVQLRYEASVGGGIPIIKALGESLAANRVQKLYGILNGTANYILTQMLEKELPFAAALKDAQRLGFAEADPTLDIDGSDTAHKLAILTRMAFGANIEIGAIAKEGIGEITQQDLQYAREMGYAIKLLAASSLQKDGLEVRVHPALVPRLHPLASVKNEYNAVFVVGDRVGELMFYGRGAGGRATATAVVADIMDIASARRAPRVVVPVSGEPRLLPADEYVCRFYLRFTVIDAPGVLGRLTTALGEHQISIESFLQKEHAGERQVPVVVQTQEVQEGRIRGVVAKIDRMEIVKAPTKIIRVERFG